MYKYTGRRLAAIWLIVGWLIVGCSAPPPPTGTLTGHVTIGPLQPVERPGEASPTPAPEVYAARNIVVYAADGRRIVATLAIGATGQYSATLPAGEYVVDINHAGIGFAKGLPTQVTVTADGVTRLDIDIDTGIR